MPHDAESAGCENPAEEDNPWVFGAGEGNAGKGFEPRAGDRILLFDYTGPIDREGRLYAPRSEQVFFETSGGELFVADRIRGDRDLMGARRLEGVFMAVRERLQRESRR